MPMVMVMSLHINIYAHVKINIKVVKTNCEFEVILKNPPYLCSIMATYNDGGIVSSVFLLARTDAVDCSMKA